eukprot:IDg13013t1
MPCFPVRRRAITRRGVPTAHWAHRTVRDDALFGYPLDQCCGGFVYLKNAILPPRCYCYLRGDAPCHLPTYGVVQELGSTELGVLCGTGVVSERTRCILVRELAKLNRERRDSPVPKYQNIIDPNIGTVDGIWVPTDFEADMYPEVEISAAIDMACRRATGGLSLPEPIMEKMYAKNRALRSSGSRVGGGIASSSASPSAISAAARAATGCCEGAAHRAARG